MKNGIIKNYRKFYLIAMFVATLLMSIGYARVESITDELVGTANLVEAKGVFIYDVNIDANSPANVFDSNISIMYSTMMQSTVVLNDNKNSTLSMAITIYNKSNDDVYFDETVYGDNFYDNNNIDFTLSGLTHGQKLSKNSNVTFTMTFKYTDEYKASNPSTFANTLNSYIGFVFKKGYSITYYNINNTSSYPSLVLEGDDLNVTFSGDVPNNIKVIGTSTNTEYVKNTDYTYSNGVLVFNDVPENLEIQKVTGGGGSAGTQVVTEDSGAIITITRSDDGHGNVIVTGYDIDTSNVQSGSVPVPTGGYDTGVLVFDGHDFDITLTAKFTFNDVATTGTNPVLDLSRYDNGSVDGFLILVANNYGGTSYNENGGTISGGSSNRYIKWRFNKYVGGTLDSDNRDYYYNGGSTPYRTNRFATQSSTITITIKVYCRNGIFTSDILYNNNVIAKPRYVAANTPYEFSFGTPVSDATIKLGTWTNKEGYTYTSKFDIIDFNVTKIIN